MLPLKVGLKPKFLLLKEGEFQLVSWTGFAYQIGGSHFRSYTKIGGIMRSISMLYRNDYDNWTQSSRLPVI